MKRFYSILLLLVSLVAINYSASAQHTISIGFDQPAYLNPTNRLNIDFPELVWSDSSATTVVYSQAEMGGTARLLTQLRIPLWLYDDTKGIIDWNMVAFGEPSDYPPAISIYFKNLSGTGDIRTLTNTSVDLSTGNGWHQVWSGNYDFVNNTFDTVWVDGTVGGTVDSIYLVINLDSAFKYTGDNLQVAFANEDGSTSLEYTYEYGFICYQTEYSSADGDPYYGPIWAFDLLMTNWSTYTMWSSDPTIWFNGVFSDNAMIRPRITFTYTMEYVATLFSEPAVKKLEDTIYNLARLNIQTIDGIDPFKLERMHFNTAGTTAGAINKAMLYYTNQTDVFDIHTATKVGTYTFAGGETEFDLIADTPFDLSGGNNYFWLVYDISATNACGDVLAATLDSISLLTANNEIETHAITDASGLATISFATAVILTTQTDYYLCNDGAEYTLDVDVLGISEPATWERSSDRANWEVMPDETATSLTFVKDTAYKFYRFTPYGPEGCDTPPTIIMNLTYEDTIAHTTIAYIGKHDLKDVPAGTILYFDSRVMYSDGSPAENVVTAYQWQINNGSAWKNINVTSNPTAATERLTLVANTIENYGRLRLIVEQDNICHRVLTSDPIQFKVTPVEFYFAEQPASKTVLCPGETYSINFVYTGELVSGKWQRNGVDLLNNGVPYTSQVLTLTGVNNSFAGEYVYVATVATSNGYATYTTEPAELFILEPTSIFEQPAKETYAPLNGVVVYSVIANHVGVTPPYYKDIYQWYRMSAGQAVKLTNNYKYKGVNSNKLTISYVVKDDFTYNGDYFFCEITSRCDVIKTDNLYLFPDEEIVFSVQPTDQTVCNGNQLSLTCKVEPEGYNYIYQWYKDGVALSNGGNISGAASETLNISAADYTLDAGDYYVEVYEANKPSDIAKSNTAVVAVNYTDIIDNLNYPSSYNEINLQLDATDVKIFDYTINTNVSVSVKYIDNGGNVIPTDGVLDGYSIVRPKITTDDNGKYVVSISNGNDCVTISDTVVVTVVDADGNPLPVANGSIDEAIAAFELQPNPTSGMFNLNYTAASVSPVKVELLDMSGMSVGTIFEGISHLGVNNFSYDFSKSHLAVGTYFVRILHDGHVYTKQLIFVK